MNRRDWLNLTPDERRDYLRREVVGATLYRDYSTPDDAIDEKERTVDVSISSDRPYDRGWYTEILSHETGAVRLERLNDGGAYLKDHDTRIQIGVFVRGTVAIKQDPEDKKFKKLGGKVLYSERKVADDEWKDVLKRIRTKTSVGYVIYKYEYDEKSDTLTATDWEPLEGSNVSIAADITTGPGRNRELRSHRADGEESDDETKCDCGDPDCDDPDCDGEAQKSRTIPKNPNHPTHTTRRLRRARKAATTQRTTTMPKRALRTICKPDSQPCENERCDVHYEDVNERGAAVSPEPANYAERFRSIAEAVALGPEEKKRFLVIASTRALESGEPDETQFREALLADRKKHHKDTTPDPEAPETTAARNGGGAARVSSRVKLVAFKGKTEDEAQAKAYRAGQFILAYVYKNEKSKQWCVEHGVRAHSESDNDSGGVLVETEHENTIIDLREEYGTFRKFATIIPMSTDKKDRPRRNGGLKAYPIGQRGTSRRLTESKKGWGKVLLEAKKWGVLAKYEDELSEDLAISIADDLTNEAAYAFTLVEDECGFLGDGSGDYHGIQGIIYRLTHMLLLSGSAASVAQTAGLVVATGTGADKWAEIQKNDTLKLMGRLPKYAYQRGAVWHCSNAFWSEVLLRIITDSGGATANEQQEGKRPLYQGYPVEISQVLPQVPDVSQVPLLFGNIAASTMFGDRRGVTMKQTDSNDTDFEEDLQSLKATERFDINPHDLGNAATNAVDRVAGPIVGLITKAS